MLAAAGLAGGLSAERTVHAAGSDTLKVGLVGCGGRGSGAALNALTADNNAKLVAMADAFADQVQLSLPRLKKAKPDQVAVDADHCFSGFDAYQKLIDSGVDVVLLATPAAFSADPSGGLRGRRQACVLREAHGGRCPRRPCGAGRRRRSEEEEPQHRGRSLLPARSGHQRD